MTEQERAEKEFSEQVKREVLEESRKAREAAAEAEKAKQPKKSGLTMEIEKRIAKYRGADQGGSHDQGNKGSGEEAAKKAVSDPIREKLKKYGRG